MGTAVKNRVSYVLGSVTLINAFCTVIVFDLPMNLYTPISYNFIISIYISIAEPSVIEPTTRQCMLRSLDTSFALSGESFFT